MTAPVTATTLSGSQRGRVTAATRMAASSTADRASAGTPVSGVAQRRCAADGSSLAHYVGRTWQDGGVGSLMLLDTASLYYRAFYGVPDTVTAPDGTPVNAVRGLLDMIARLVRAREPARLVACMDEDWRPAFRVEAVPSYKAHRVAQGNDEQTPDKLVPQVPIINDVLAATGLAVAGAKGYEADDVIATLAVGARQPVAVS